jgi:drug/metabolite transporter (DMT)-like permease
MTSTKNTQQHKPVLLPILLTCIGYACYNLCDVGTKTLVLKLHFSQVMLTTSAFVIFFMSIYGWFKDGKKTFRTNKPGLMFIRAALAQVSTIANLLALPYITLTTFYTLVFTSPFWVALISAYFFKDKLDKRRMGVILFGFCVVLFIFRPGGGLFNVWTILMLFSAFAYSWQLLVVRKIGSGESRPLMYICGSVMSMVIGLFFLGDHYVPLTLHEWSIFASIGFINAIGMLCISYAFQEAPSASAVAPYHYTQIIWGALLGYYFFSEIPDVETMAGAALIILAGIYLIHHETRKAALKPAEA